MIELKWNKYINVLMDLYNITHVVKEEPEIIKTKSKKFPFKIEEKKVYPEYNKIMEKIDYIKDTTFSPNGMDFNDIWEFCQFVKYAEKTMFFYNDPNNLFYVDSDLDDINKRQFVIKDISNNYQIIFKLERSNDPVKNDILRIIRLTVNRFYGRKMTNEFIIVNSEIKYNDDADIYLIDKINRILASIAESVFDTIIKSVGEKEHGKW